MGVKALSDLVTGDKQQEKKPEERRANYLTAVMGGLGQGLSFNMADEAAAGLAATYTAPFSKKTWKELYNEQLAIERENLAINQRDYPMTTALGSLGGGLMTGKALGSAGLTLANKAKTVGQAIGLGALEGGAYGAAYGAGGATEGNRLQGAGEGGAIGAATGGIVGGITGAMAKPQVPAPATEEVKAASQAAYKAMDQAGVVLSPKATESTIGAVKQKLFGAGFDPDAYPDVSAALRSLEKSPVLSLSQLDLKRQMFRDIATNATSKESRLAKIAIEGIDNAVRNLDDSQVVAGDTTLAKQAIQSARQLWGRYAKAETIDDMMEIADTNAGQYSVSGKENAIRTEFRKLYRGLVRNKGERALYSDAELEAIKKVATGGPIENVMRLFGKAAVRGPVSAIPTGIGYAVGGPIGAGAVAGVGEIGRLGAAAATSSNARLASELIRRGGPSALNMGRNPAMINAAIASQNTLSDEQKRALARMLSGGQ